MGTTQEITAVQLGRERIVILGLLLALAAAAWAVLLRQQADTGGMDMGLTMGRGALLFLAIWVVMMVAMMFPTAAPMILMFARVQAGRRKNGRAFVPAWLFVGAYLGLWSALGVIAYLLATGADALATESMWVMDNAGRLGGAVILLVGLYQLSPLKALCLTKCRAPLTFVMTSWREGRWGALRMGLEHATYCAGCCWLLFVLLFPLGIMNVAAMAVVTLLVFAEKALPIGPAASKAAAAVLIAYGLVAMISPDVLPSTVA